MKTGLLFISLLFFSGHIFALNGKEVLQSVRANYEGLNDLQIEMQYELYKGYFGQEVVESYTSEFARRENTSYRRVDQVEWIKTEKYSIQVNHVDKSIFLSDPVEVEPLDVDISTVMSWCQNVIVSKKEKGSILTLILRGETDIPYTRLEVQLDKKNWIEQVTFYYAAKVDFSDSYFRKDMDYPKLVVRYAPLKKRWKAYKSFKDKKQFIDIQGEKVTLLAPVQTYQLFDLRKK